MITSYPVPTGEILPQVDRDAIWDTLFVSGLSYEEYIVVGGANMVLRGIKSTTEDIDMLVSDTAFEYLIRLTGAKLKEPPKTARDRGATNVTAWVMNDSFNLPISATTSLGDGYYPMSFEDQRGHVENVDGIPCLPLDMVWGSKAVLQRDKDLADLKLLSGHLVRPMPSLLPLEQRQAWWNS